MRTVNTTLYRAMYSKRPYGQGNWFFRIGKEIYAMNGTYSEVRRMALSMAEESHTYDVFLLPMACQNCQNFCGKLG